MAKFKKVSRNPGASSIPEGYNKMIQWCWNNSIAVCVVPDWDKSSDYWKIEIKINNNVHVDPTTYTVENVHNKMYEYYKYYYDKYNEKN